MKPFYSFKTADFTPTSYKSKYLSEYYNQARSLLRFQFPDEAIQNILAEEKRDGNNVQWHTSFPREFKRISEFMNYRTALRNLTQGLDTVEKINNVAYPLKPQI